MIAIQRSQRSTRRVALSHSSAPTYYCGSAILGWGGEAERAIEWAECGSTTQPVRSLALCGLSRVDTRAIFTAAVIRRRLTAPTRPSKLTRAIASHVCCWQRHWRSSAE